MIKNNDFDIEDKKIEEVKALLEKGEDINNLEEHGKTFLELAILDKHNKVVKFLLDNGANVNTIDWENQTPLMFAIVNYNHEATSLLIQKGSDVNANVGWEQYPLIFTAIKKNNQKAVLMLLQNGVDINAFSEEGQTLLMIAIEKGELDYISMLLQNGANINSIDNKNKTPLMYAIEKGHQETISMLIQNGADINAVDNIECTPLIYAVLHNDLEVMRMLIERGVELNSKYGERALMEAVHNGSLEAITMLIHSGVKVNIADIYHRTPLINAIERGDSGIIRLLIETGANVNGFKGIKKTPLIYAIEKGKLDAISILMENGVNVNEADSTKQTPIIAAIEKHNHEILVMLIKGGADVNAVNWKQQTPLMYALENNIYEVLITLIHYGADIDFVDKNQRTLLMVAIENGYQGVITALIQKNVDINVVDQNQQTPLMYAIARGNYETALILIQKGANVNAVNLSLQTPLILAIDKGNIKIADLLVRNGANIAGLEKATKPMLKLLLNQDKEAHINSIKSWFTTIENVDAQQYMINILYKVNNWKLLELLGNPNYKLVSLEYQINNHLSLDLEKSPNKLKYTAVVNILHNIGESVPNELQRLINDYSFEESLSKEQKKLIADQLPKLSKYFIREALYKDLYSIGKKFKIGQNHPVMEEIKGYLEIIYTTTNLENFEEAKENLKLILLKERVKHKLENENDIKEIVNIINKGKKQGISAHDIVRNVQNRLLAGDYGILLKKIKSICNNFEVLRPIHSIESLQHRILHNSLNQMNEDFRLEISAALDLTHTKMTGKEVIYRVIRTDFSNREIHDMFEVGHTKLSQGATHLLYDKTLTWTPVSGDWDGNAVYTSFDPAFTTNYINGQDSLLFEYRPEAGELGIEGLQRKANFYEIIFNQLRENNIKAIYKIENNIITDVFQNPYYEARENEPELSFKEGENIMEASQKYRNSGQQAYKDTKFNRNEYRYKSVPDFKERYGKKEMEAKRTKLYEERGYRNYEEQFKTLPKENWPSTYTSLTSENAIKLLAERKETATSQTSSAGRVLNPFAYISATIKQIKGVISSLEKEFMQQAVPPKSAIKNHQTNIALINSPAKSSWFSSDNVAQAFDAIYVLQNEVRLAKALYTLGSQMLNHTKQMAEDLLDEKVNQREFIDTLQKASKEIEQDVGQLDTLSEKIKKSGRSDSKLYRDELVDLEAIAIEIEQDLKTFKDKEQMPKGRLEKLERKTKEYSKKIDDLIQKFEKTKDQNSSKEKKMETNINNFPINNFPINNFPINNFPINNFSLGAVTKQYQTLSKEAESLLSSATGEDKSNSNSYKSKYKFSEKFQTPKDPQKGR